MVVGFVREVRPSSVSRLTKCAIRAPPPPLTSGAAPQVKKGRKIKFQMPDFLTLMVRNVVIFGTLTQFWALFRTVLAKSRSEKTTLFDPHSPPPPQRGGFWGWSRTSGNPVGTPRVQVPICLFSNRTTPGRTTPMAVQPLFENQPFRTLRDDISA